MSSNLLSIASSGAQAAEIALDVTGQNIANATTTGQFSALGKMALFPIFMLACYVALLAYFNWNTAVSASGASTDSTPEK